MVLYALTKIAIMMRIYVGSGFKHAAERTFQHQSIYIIIKHAEFVANILRTEWSWILQRPNCYRQLCQSKLTQIGSRVWHESAESDVRTAAVCVRIWLRSDVQSLKCSEVQCLMSDGQQIDSRFRRLLGTATAPSIAYRWHVTLVLDASRCRHSRFTL
ncbi:uncharacterized protein LOC143367057 [Andrena cerasifolii]|uniref:uncharacterized protein LOC143367057 n=1 Tax=Andrena cerasifolii TaxID=2819439 RepID=UPI0040378074